MYYLIFLISALTYNAKKALIPVWVVSISHSDLANKRKRMPIFILVASCVIASIVIAVCSFSRFLGCFLERQEDRDRENSLRVLIVSVVPIYLQWRTYVTCIKYSIQNTLFCIRYFDSCVTGSGLFKQSFIYKMSRKSEIKFSQYAHYIKMDNTSWTYSRSKFRSTLQTMFCD